MGRDHAYECDRCGTLYGGLNDPDTTECPNCCGSEAVANEGDTADIPRTVLYPTD